MNRKNSKIKNICRVVEDNKILKNCRVRIRVMNVFDGKKIKTEDLLWATPFKDLNETHLTYLILVRLYLWF